MEYEILKEERNWEKLIKQPSAYLSKVKLNCKLIY